MKKELIIVQTFDKDGFLTGYEVNGELVRCKDCRYFHEKIWGSDIGFVRPYDRLIIGPCCCEFWGRKEDGSMTLTAEDAFCSFGERRSE